MSGYANRSGGSGPGGPGDTLNDNLEVDAENPNIVRAVPSARGGSDETAGNTSPSTRSDDDGYGDIIEGSDSERTGTSWGLPGRESSEVQTSAGTVPEGEGDGEAHPNRNTGDRVTREELDNVGSWSTIDTDDSAGSPSGFS
ncbi:MAG TPA: hypothetical protein VF914_07925 [Chloroflexia bacterium]|jgi:hypothetical protein